MDTTKLKELREKADAKRKRLHEIFTEAGPDMDMSKVKTVAGDEGDKVKALKSLNDELSELGVELEPLEAEYAEIEKAKRSADDYAAKHGHPVPEKKGGRENEPETKTIGELFVESEAGAELKGQSVELDGVDVKALFMTTAGWEPESLRTGRVVPFATRPIQVTDVVPSGSTGMAAVVYMEETTFTNNAKETGEGAEKPEAALGLTQRTSPVRKIAVWLPVTDEQLEDVPQVEGYVNNRLPFMVSQRLDSQILNGKGEENELLGFLHKENVQTHAKGADPTPDAIYKANTLVEVTGRAIPGPAIFHPNDWQEVRLLRTAEGVYIWGSPSEEGPERIWGQRVIKSDALPEGTALTGDFANFSELPIRRGMQIKVSDSHSDFFIKNKQAIRAEMRTALVIYRPTAFCTVTGI